MRCITGDAQDRAEAIALADDAELVAAWRLCGDKAGDAASDELAREMERRGIDY